MKTDIITSLRIIFDRGLIQGIHNRMNCTYLLRVWFASRGILNNDVTDLGF